MWHHTWDDTSLSGVSVIALVVFKTLPYLSLTWRTSNLGSDHHGGKNAVTLFSINKI